MRISGHLLNATPGGTPDVFDGYVIEIRYVVEVERGEAPTYRDVTDQWTFRDKDNQFTFTLPEPQELALDKALAISVRNRSGRVVFQSEESAARVIRAERPLELPIDEIEPAPVVTPVNVHGRLEWKDAPEKTDGFEGFKILVTFAAREEDDPTYVPRLASATLTSGNEFTIALPAKERLQDAPVEVAAKSPDGQVAATATHRVEALRKEVVLTVEPPQPVVVRTDVRADDAQPERLKGKVVDLAGQVAIKHRQVILWGQIPSGVRPVLVAVTDATGNFAGEWPRETFTRAFGTVAGTRNATPETGLAIDLEVQGEPVEGEASSGTLPKFVYLVVTAAPDAAVECDCHDGTAPRQPDPEDLVANPDAYSQDIGLNCVNFTTPNRTLEEFVYTLVVRTTDPEIKGTTLADVERRAAHDRSIRELVGPKLTRESALAAATRELSPFAATKALTPITKESALLAAKEELSPFAVTKALTAEWANAFKTVAARGELMAQNSVDWDSTPTFYQAATIAHGHILYYKQIWKADGYSLGDLLYSLPLAPGQKKQIVIFDWDRSEYGRRDEATHEDEALDAYLSHNRDILDITHGSVAEQMRGGSSSRTSGSAGGVGAGIGALIGPVMIGVAGGYSTSSGSASSSAWQNSSRDVSASGLNQLRDVIQQGASAVRNQRSTVVQTARQTERFRVETDVVANHNHCHAITIEYFEVLRHYAIEQQLTQVQECLFIPLLMSAFDLAKVMRWRDILRAVLLLPRRRAPRIFQEQPLLRGIDAVERIYLNYEGSDFPSTTYAAESLVNLSGELRISFRLNRPLDDDDNADDPARQEQLITVATLQSALGWNVWWPLLPYGPNETFQQFFANQKVKYKNKIFEERVASVLAEAVVDQLTFTAVTATGGRIPLAVDTTLVSSYQRDVPLYCTVRPKGPINVRRDQIEYIEIATGVDLSQSAQSKIIIHSATFRYSTAHLNAYLAQDYRVDNDLKPNDPVVIYTPLSAEEKRNPREEDKYFSKLLIEHLNAHIEYYHKAIWSQMDPDRRYMLLDGFLAPNANGKSVASVVENRVIGVAGNSLIMPVAPGYKLDPTYTYEPVRDDEGRPVTDDNGNIVYEQTSLLDHYKPLTPAPPYRVSVPTRGVFAEAVMGACNSCEKWDESRYWKWEEHPIPEEPTPIAPIETRAPQRTEPGAMTPTAFPTPMINIQNAPTAPEPGATLTGALGLLGKSDIFKDITGLDQTQKNALQAMLSNQETAKHFADKAAELAVQSANLKSAPTTIDSIKKSMADGTIDKATGKQLIADAYHAQISGKTAPEQPVDSASHSELGHAAADAVKSGREVTATQTHPDGTTTSVAQKADEPTEGKGDGGMLSSSVSPFSEKLYPTEMRPSATHNARLATAMQTVRGTLSTANKKRLDNVCIIVCKLTPSGDMDYAGVRETEMFFSGSLLKVALLYASFELVARVNTLAPLITAGSAKDFFGKVGQVFDPKIANAVPKITPGPWRKVQFDGALVATADASGAFRVTMSPLHDQDLRSIFLDQNQNVGARECMHRLGFSYVNGALEAAGLLGLVTETGIWMATDYVDDNPPGPGNWRSFNIPVVTNGTSSAAMTALTMSNLLNKLHRRELIDAASSQTMRDIFATGGAWLSTLANPSAFSFTAEGAKVGHSSSASAGVSTVMSEALFLKRKTDSAPFVAVWQNVPDPLGAEPIYQVIDELVKNWP
jgi:hypothetical protein